MNTLFDKIWDAHVVTTVEDGPTQLYIDRLYCHEVTSPQAFAGLRERGIGVLRPEKVFCMPDHNTPTHDQDKEILAGAQQIAESLINQILDREDIRSIDVIAVLSAEVGKHVGLRNANIEKLDQRRKYYIDLKERFRAKLNEETFINDLFQKKI